MKKTRLLLALLAIGIMPVTLASCGEHSSPATSVADEQDQARVDAAKEALTCPTTVQDDFTLSTSGAGNVVITWASSNEEVIKIDGSTAKVSRPTDADATVTLTATLTYNTASATKTFDVTVTHVDIGDVVTLAEVRSNFVVGAEYRVTGVVAQFAYNSQGVAGFYLTDATDTFYVFGYQSASELKIGDEIVITANGAAYFGCPQLSLPNIELVIGSGREVPTDAYIELEYSAFYEQANAASDFTTGNAAQGDLHEEKLAFIGHTYVVNAAIIYHEGKNFGSWEIAENAEGNHWFSVPYSDKEDNSAYNTLLSQYEGQVLDVAVIAYNYSSSDFLQIAIVDVFPEGFSK